MPRSKRGDRRQALLASDFDRRLAVVYARVSSRDQEREGYSIPAQLDLLRQYAVANGFGAIQEFIDVETAKQAGRTAFGEMIGLLQKTPSCRVVLVEKTDRLYRNLKDWVTVDELGLEVHLVKENVVLSPESRSSEKFMHGIKVLMAKNYVDNLSEEVRKGLHQKAQCGIWPSFAPLGYLNVAGSDGKKTIQPDPELAPLITRMFERYATGTYSIQALGKLARGDGLVFRKSGHPIPNSTVHKILRNRLYSGDYDYKGATYTGTYQPIVTRDLWEQVQAILEGRRAKRPKKRVHEFAFSGLITCGHCGCALVGEVKKCGRYTYYHCTAYRGRCPEPYTREEVLAEKFTALLKNISFSTEVLSWVTRALRDSHQDEKQFHDEAIVKLQREYRRIQDRIDAMYLDKLDGRIEVEFFDRKSSEWRAEQCRIQRDIDSHQAANQNYIEDGIKLLELAQQAPRLFESQEAREKRKLLDFVLSNCTWKDGELTAKYRQPFDVLALAVAADRESGGGNGPETGDFDNWRRGRDSNPR